MKWSEMLIVSHRGANHRFCISLGVFRTKSGVSLKARHSDKLTGFEADFISLV